jgi:TRAP-type C4-dicarboxylate transport system permease small subunit
MAATWRWFVRLFALLAMLLFGALMVIFIVVTVNHFGEKQYVTDNVGGLPPVYVITAILVPFCAAFVGGFWMLFLDSFKRQAAAEQLQAMAPTTAPTAAPAPAPAAVVPGAEEALPRRERLARWAREHKPRWPGGGD